MYPKTSIVIYAFALLAFLAAFRFHYEQRRPPMFVDQIYHKSKNSGNRQLLPLQYTPLPLGAIRPTRDSWLEHELHNSATGLAGHLWDFYAFVKDSTWLGGSAGRGNYSALHEGFPYWFNGLVSLSYSLPTDAVDQAHPEVAEVARLKEQVHTAAEFVLKAQAQDGWLGPETIESGERVLWGRFPFLLGLKSLVEANSTGWERKVMPALWRFVGLTHDMISDGGKGFVYQGADDTFREKDYSYGKVRVADMVLILQWLLEKDPTEDQERMVWACMDMFYELSTKWEAWYTRGTYIKEDLADYTDLLRPVLHGVNIAQGLKTMAVMHRFTHNTSLIDTSFDAVDWTFQYHGAASGTILADELVNGLAPYNGSELCTTVEMIFSLIHVYHALGRNDDADRAELAAFNALPSMLTSDHWAHQYMTQPNQPWSRNLSMSPFFDANSQAQTFGLEPHYPCCTVNHPQGLPKFLAGSWVKVGADGLAHVLLSPGTVSLDGISIKCHTNYPFAETLIYDINTTTPFKLYLRIPNWASTSNVHNEHDSIPLGHIDSKKHMHEIPITTGQTKLTYILETSIRTQPRANDTIAVYHGALLYALEIQHEAKSSPPKNYKNQSTYPATYAPDQARDWVLTNTSSWNIAIDPSTLAFHRRDDTHLPDQIWAASGPPTYMTARGCEIEWPLFEGAVPGAPIPLEKRVCLVDPLDVRLVPLGSAKLHMAELPVIDLS